MDKSYTNDTTVKRNKRMTRIPSMYSMVKLTTKDRSYTTDTGRVQNNIRSWTCKDVVQWLTMNYFDKEVIKNFKRSKIDGAALLSLDLDKLKTDLGVTRIGQQKRLMILIWSNSTDYNNGHSKSKSNSNVLTSAHIITVLYHRNVNDYSEGTVHRLFFNSVPTYRDFIQQLSKQLSTKYMLSSKSIFYYDEQDKMVYVNNSKSWYSYMEMRESDPSIMLEISTINNEYSLLDMMDCYALVTDNSSNILYCNSKLRSVLSDSTSTKYSDIICTESNTIIGSNCTVAINNIQTVPTIVSPDCTVYLYIIT